MEIGHGAALRLWHAVTLSLVRGDEPDLSARQLAVLLAVYLEPPPHTVRGLAAHLHVTKPAITRALDTLGGMGLLSRQRDEADRRNVIVQPTEIGGRYIDRLGSLIADTARDLS